MSEQPSDQIPGELQPTAGDVDYDLEEILNAVVSVRSRIPDDAFTAPILGTERAGHGVLVAEDGLVATIGYLVTEADEIWLVDSSGAVVPGHVVGYDYETGFGLVQALKRLPSRPVQIGSAEELLPGDEIIVAGYGGARQSLKAHVVAKQEFAGYWEYVIDEAIYTTPPHPNWGGAGLIGLDGTLCGIASLYIDNIATRTGNLHGNMIVPIDLLLPIMNDLLRYGYPLKPPRPWLGVFVTEAEEELIIAGMYANGPAERSELREGDVVLAVAGEPVNSLAPFFRKIWSLGEAGVQVPLTVSRGSQILEAQVATVDRRQFWKGPQLH